MEMPHQNPQAPTVTEISAAMAALGIYARPPTDGELAEQARSVGGEHVFAAVLANALYGAAIGTGMLTEGYMLEAGAGAREMALARQQVIRASGADGLGVVGALHWQAGHIWHFFSGMESQDDPEDRSSVIAAAASASHALLALLACMGVRDPNEPSAAEMPENIVLARKELRAAVAHLDTLGS
ncbi:DUF6245 family protein [Streptomyces brevispora]|uniref:DUF6245 family protein n=1 Tax=Streptomyces brevispora TaxID=887462 RepID=UPI003719BF67